MTDDLLSWATIGGLLLDLELLRSGQGKANIFVLHTFSKKTIKGALRELKQQYSNN